MAKPTKSDEAIQTGVDVSIDQEETIANLNKPPGQVYCFMYNPDVEAVFAVTRTAPGCVRIGGNGTHGTPEPPPNVITGPDTEDDCYILIIKPGQKCCIFGKPVVRFFHKSNA